MQVPPVGTLWFVQSQPQFLGHLLGDAGSRRNIMSCTVPTSIFRSPARWRRFPSEVGGGGWELLLDWWPTLFFLLKGQLISEITLNYSSLRFITLYYPSLPCRSLLKFGFVAFYIVIMSNILPFKNGPRLVCWHVMNKILVRIPTGILGKF